MEYVAGGNMADYILKTILLKFGSFDTRDGLVMEEEEARFFFTQVIDAVDYCHMNKVAHRCVYGCAFHAASATCRACTTPPGGWWQAGALAVPLFNKDRLVPPLLLGRVRW